MVSFKADIVRTESIEPLAEYPGFVKVLTGNMISSNIKEYLKAKSLNENIPKKIMDFMKLAAKITRDSKESVVITLDCNPLSVAHKVEVFHNGQPISSQDGGLDKMQKVFFENLFVCLLRPENVTDELAKISSMLDKAPESCKNSEIDMSAFMGKFSKIFQEIKTNPSDKFNGNDSSKASSYLNKAGCESSQVIEDKENSEEEGKPAQRIAKQSKKEVASCNDTQQKSIETDVANISETSGNTDSNNTAIQEKTQLLERMIFRNYIDELLNLGSKTVIPDSTGDLKKVKIMVPEETSELPPRKSGIDIVMSKKLNDWPDNAKYWFARDRQEKSKLGKDIVSLMKESCIYIVAKHPEAMQDPDEIEYTFRMSFSHPERILCNAMNETQVKCYRLMKALHNAKFKRCSERFCSYHIKTTIFWAMEKNETDLWTAENLEVCITLLLTILLNAIEDKYLGHFFIQRMNLFEGFTAEELGKLKHEINELLTDLASAFQDVLNQFKSKSKIISEKTHSSSDTAASSEKSQITLIRFKAWSEEYDKIVKELLLEVSSSSSMLSSSRFSEKIRSTIQNAIKQEKMTIEGFRQFFETSRKPLFQRYCFSVKDATRSLSSVILEAIENLDCFLNYAISSYEELATDDSLTLKILEGYINSDTEVERAVSAFMPNSTDIAESFIQFLFNC